MVYVKIADKRMARAKVIKALAHPTRLLLIDKLSEGDKCVCDLTAIALVDISTVSKHLSVLKKAGLVNSKKDGLKVIYHLLMPCVSNFFSCIDNVITTEKENKKCQNN